MADIPALPERKTLLGGFSAYCKVCWEPVYCLWIDANDDPGGICMENALTTDPMKCSLARSRFEWKAAVAAMRREGILKSAPATPPTKDAGHVD